MLIRGFIKTDNKKAALMWAAFSVRRVLQDYFTSADTTSDLSLSLFLVSTTETAKYQVPVSETSMVFSVRSLEAGTELVKLPAD